MNYIVANWKMDLTIKEALDLARKIQQGLENKSADAEVVLCPSFTALRAVGQCLKNIKLGAQDVFWEEKGAYTGEISTKTLRDLGCEYVILGHSERRRLGETPEMVRKKVEASLEESLVPIICVGETSEERKKHQIDSLLRRQVKKIFQPMKLSAGRQIIIAYEPIWAIGTGKAIEFGEALAAQELIKKILADLFPTEVVQNFSIIYGGSVNSKNINDFVGPGKTAGALVGTASLKAAEFIGIVKAVSSK